MVDTASSKSYLQFLHQLSEEKSRVAIVPPDMEGRPDLLSYAAYGTELLWWLIVQANNISDYEEDLAAGKQIKIPII